MDFTMKSSSHTAEQSIRNLKTVEQLISHINKDAEVCCVIEVVQPTCHR